jgi:hypothetical protein
MNRKWSTLGIITVGSVIVGHLLAHFLLFRSEYMPSQVEQALDEAQDYELLSLHPRLSDGEFHFHRVLGRVKIDDPAIRKQLNDALRRSFRQSEGRSGTYDKPRHGIRVSRSGEIVDLRIDFEGRDVHIYRNNEPDGSFSITDSAQAIFNDVLKKANIPIVGKFDAEEDDYERFGKPIGSSIGHAR